MFTNTTDAKYAIASQSYATASQITKISAIGFAVVTILGVGALLLLHFQFNVDLSGALFKDVAIATGSAAGLSGLSGVGSLVCKWRSRKLHEEIDVNVVDKIWADICQGNCKKK